MSPPILRSTCKSDRADEGKAVEILQQLTPAMVLHSQKLRSSFQSFLHRGTITEREQLFLLNNQPNLPDKPSKPNATASRSRLACKNRDRRRQSKSGPKDSTPPALSNSSKSKTSQPPSSPAASSNHPSQPHGTKELDLAEVHAYVCETGSKDPHPRNFISAAVSYVSLVENPVDGLEDFQINYDVFGKGKSRFSHLYYGYQQAQKAGAMFSCLSRLILVLMRHELDYRASMIEKGRLGQGRGRMTGALEELSRELSVEKEKLKDDNARATLYYKLIEESGPGDLATLGIGNNHAWEKTLSLQDVSFLVSFRHHQFPEVETAARKYDFPIARLMIKALIACGWEHEELVASKTRLLKQLDRFVDIQKLAHGEIVETVNSASHTPPRKQPSPNGNKRKPIFHQPCAKKRRDSVQEQNVKFHYGKYVHVPLYLDSLDDAHNMVSERLSGASGPLKCINTEGLPGTASAPGIETTKCPKLPTSLQVDIKTIGALPNDAQNDCTRPSASDYIQRTNSLVNGVPAISRETRSMLHHAESATIICDGDNNDDNSANDNGPKPLVYPYHGKKQAQVEAQDFERLHDNGLLNDNLIGLYIRFLEDHLDRTNKDTANRVFFFNTYFYTTLTDRPRNRGRIDFNRVQKWTQGVDIFSYDYIVVPINESIHWYVAIICNLPNLQGIPMMASGLNNLSSKDMQGPSCEAGGDIQMIPEMLVSSQDKAKPYNGHPETKFQDPVIITFDSLNEDRSRTVKRLRQYLAEEAKSKKGIEINPDLIAGLKAQSIPLQSNSSDCGLYLLAYVEKFAQDPDQFISRLLQKEMDIQTDWPSLTSSHLRLRLRKFLDNLRDEQEQFNHDVRKGERMADRWPASFLLGDT